MDRNSIFAYVLIFLVLIGWMWWAGSANESQKMASRTGTLTSDSLQTTAPFESKAVLNNAAAETFSAITQPESGPAEPVEPARTITIKTPLYEVEISTHGANLTRWTLATYELKNGLPVELIPPRGLGADIALGPEGNESSLSSVDFKVGITQNSIFVADSQSLVFIGQQGSRTITKTWTFYAENYIANLDVRVDGPMNLDRIALFWDGGIPPAEANWEQELSQATNAMALIAGDLEDLNYSDERDTLSIVGSLEWVGQKNHYFFAGCVVGGSGDQWDITITSDGVRSGDQLIREEYRWKVAPVGGGGRTLSATFYMGPIDINLMEKAAESLTRAADLGWSVIRPISFVILAFFQLIHKFVPNYGLVIIIFSVAVKLVLYPLTHKSFEASTKMKVLQPKMQEIKEKYADDSTEMNKHMMKLYKDEGFNPLSGCLPMVLQMPIFFAIYAVIRSNIEFRHAPFILWIDDLSAPDVIAALPTAIPFYGSHISILPFIMSGSMFIQQKMTVADPRQKTMMYIMPVVMLFIFNNMASGLVLYWTMFNILSSLQQVLIKKKQADGDDSTTTEVAQIARPKASSKGPRKLPGQ